MKKACHYMMARKTAATKGTATAAPALTAGASPEIITFVGMLVGFVIVAAVAELLAVKWYVASAHEPVTEKPTGAPQFSEACSVDSLARKSRYSVA